MNGMPEQVTLVVQAGGQSSRMGVDKALKVFIDRPLIARVVERLALLAGEILVTANHPAEYAFLNLRVLPDLIQGRGTLGGLYTALFHASYPVVAVAACDLPFASLPIFRESVRLLVQEDVDIVVPRSSGGLEPLHAVYRRETCLPVIRDALRSQQLKAIDWFPRVRVRELDSGEITRLDPSRLAFWNINTAEEFLEAEQFAKQG